MPTDRMFEDNAHRQFTGIFGAILWPATPSVRARILRSKGKIRLLLADVVRVTNEIDPANFPV